MIVWTTWSFVGYHKWENAPKEVDFLKNLHRHLFKVKVFVEVSHNDRDVEFFILQKKLKAICLDFDKKMMGSCEMIAEDIKKTLIKEYLKNVQVEVSEDGESGAIV